MIRGYTNIEQSRKLAEILPLESADMFYTTNCDWQGKIIGLLDVPLYIGSDGFIDTEMGEIYAWSLAALLEQLHYELCDDDGNSLYLQINKEDDMYKLAYEDPYGDLESIETDGHEHFVDACVAMIEGLHELNLL